MKTNLLGLLIGALLAGTASANMGTVDLQETEVSPRVTTGIHSTSPNLDANAYAGVYRFSMMNLNSTYFASLPTWGFCIEMQYSGAGYLPYQIISLEDAPLLGGPNGNEMGPTKADYIRELWTAYIGEATSGNANKAAAFQAAVWEIVYEDAQAWNVNSWVDGPTSSFKADNTTIGATANGWLADILAKDCALANLVALSNDAKQDYVVAVPVPAAAGLVFVGLGLVGWFRRRFA